MEGSAVDDDWEFSWPTSEVRTGKRKSEEMKQLLSLVTDEVIVELKEGPMKLRDNEISQLKELFDRLYEEQLKTITDMVSRCFSLLLSLKKTTHRLEQQLAEEQSARLKAEAMALDANDEICNLTEQLERAQRETQELKGAQSVGCAIL